jgi:L-amino acid N-acyltransferase YncA
MKIRKARKEDLSQIVSLYVAYLKYQIKFAKWLGNSNIKIDKNEIKLWIKASLNKKEHIFLVAEENNIIKGFVNAEIMSYKESRTKKKVVVEIIDIYSHAKRKGTGRLFFKEIEKWAKKNKAYYIFWEFITGNKIAENFCRKNKFRDFKTKMLKKTR